MAVIFVGNGINQNEGLVYSWDKLLDKSIEPPKQTDSVKNKSGTGAANGIKRPKVEGLSMTMGFEMLEFFAVDRSIVKNGYQLKKRIASVITKKIGGRIKEHGFDWNKTIHARIMSLPVNTYFTTNYDYALEQSVNPDFKRQPTTQETTYSRMRFQTVKVGGTDKKVYHIHGEVKAPNSICLGFEHYSGTLEKMRSDLVRSTKDKNNNLDEHEYHLKDVMTGVELPDLCWYLKFFSEDIYILGFNIDFSEQDLWWLIDYRYRQMRYKKLPIINHVYFIDVDKPEDRETTNIKARNTALSQFGVEVKIAKGDSYSERYNWAIEWIEKNLKK